MHWRFITGSGRKRCVFHRAPFLRHAFKGAHTSDMLDLFNNLWGMLGGSHTQPCSGLIPTAHSIILYAESMCLLCSFPAPLDRDNRLHFLSLLSFFKKILQPLFILVETTFCEAKLIWPSGQNFMYNIQRYSSAAI